MKKNYSLLLLCAFFLLNSCDESATNNGSIYPAVAVNEAETAFNSIDPQLERIAIDLINDDNRSGTGWTSSQVENGTIKTFSIQLTDFPTTEDQYDSVYGTIEMIWTSGTVNTVSFDMDLIFSGSGPVIQIDIYCTLVNYHGPCNYSKIEINGHNMLDELDSLISFLE